MWHWLELIIFLININYEIYSLLLLFAFRLFLWCFCVFSNHFVQSLLLTAFCYVKALKVAKWVWCKGSFTNATKGPSVGREKNYSGHMAYIIFLRNKTFLFFKIESWKFQQLFEKEFRETWQNFNSIRQLTERMKITIVWMDWMRWNFVRFHEIQFQTDAKSFSFLSGKTKKFYS